MLHPKLDAYLSQIEQLVSNLDSVYVEQYEEEILTPERGNLRIRIRFQLGYLLAINEAIIRYHFQDEHNQLVFRYDSTPHFPDLATAPHHKHLPETVVASEKPKIVAVLMEAATHP